MTKRKEFDTSTAYGLKNAERYKAKLENRFDRVEVTPVGLNRVRIEGKIPGDKPYLIQL